MTNVTIRTARANDVPAVLELWREADAPPTVTDSEAAVHAVIERDDEALLLAIVDARVVGTLIATWDGWRGNMYRLAVHPNHRRRGVATRLVNEAEKRLHALGCRRISALVLEAETHAVEFWSRVGYTTRPGMARFKRNL